MTNGNFSNFLTVPVQSSHTGPIGGRVFLGEVAPVLGWGPVKGGLCERPCPAPPSHVTGAGQPSARGLVLEKRGMFSL